MEPTQNFWQSVSGRLPATFDAHVLEHWITPIRFLRYENGKLDLEVPTDFHRGRVRDQYLTAIQEVCREVSDDFKTIELIVAEQAAQPAQEPVAGHGPQIPPTLHQTTEPLPRVAPRRGWLLDRFVVGEENRMAHAAARSVVEGLRHLNRPAQWEIVYFYGPCGVGKTHLLKGMFEEASGQPYRQAFVGAETWVNTYLKALRDKTAEAFRREFRSLRLLIVDDLDFLFKGDKDSSLGEFLCTLEAINANHGCVVLCANKSPREMESKNKKLLSLLGSGLTIQVSAPESKTMGEIVAFRAEHKKLVLDQEAVTAIAERCHDVREAIGVLSNLGLLSKFYGRPVDSEMLGEAWGHLGIKLPQPVTIRRIQEMTAQYFKLRVDMLKGKDRTRKITHPRQIAMFLCRELLPDKPLNEIADAFHKDHSTVLSAYKKISKGDDLVVDQELDAIRALIRT